MSSAGVVAAIATNNLLRLVRQPVMLFTTLLLPFMVIAVVGFALGGTRGELRAGFLSQDRSPAAGQLRSALAASDGLKLESFGDVAGIERAVRRGEVSAGIVVPADYGRTLEAGDPTSLRFLATPNQSRAASIRTLLQAALSRTAGTIQAAVFSHDRTGRSIAAEQARATQLASTVVAPSVAAESIATPHADELGFSYTAPSNLVLFIVITSLTSAATLIETRSRGITAREMAMPVSRTSLILGELLGRFAIAIAQAGVILLISGLLFGVDWGSPAGVAALTVAICGFGAGLGLLVGFSAKTVAQAVSFGPPLGIVMGMLGGCMWPLSIVGPFVRTLGHVTPQAWAMDGYLRLVNGKAGIGDVLPQVAALVGFSVLILAVAGWVVGRSRFR